MAWRRLGSSRAVGRRDGPGEGVGHGGGSGAPLLARAGAARAQQARAPAAVLKPRVADGALHGSAPVAGEPRAAQLPPAIRVRVLVLHTMPPSTHGSLASKCHPPVGAPGILLVRLCRSQSRCQGPARLAHEVQKEMMPVVATRIGSCHYCTLPGPSYFRSRVECRASNARRASAASAKLLRAPSIRTPFAPGRRRTVPSWSSGARVGSGAPRLAAVLCPSSSRRSSARAGTRSAVALALAGEPSGQEGPWIRQRGFYPAPGRESLRWAQPRALAKATFLRAALLAALAELV